MELKIISNSIPQAIEFNYDELKAWVTEKADFYNAIVYTDENVKAAKTDKANINKFIKAINQIRIEKKKELLKPYEDFEKKIKELESIISEPLKKMDAEIKAYEDGKKAEKLEEIKSAWESIENKPEWLKCNSIFDKKWLNATTSISTVRREMQMKVDIVVSQLKWLEEMPFSYEAIEVFKSTVDYEKAMEEGKKIHEINQRKAEAEKAEQPAEMEQIPGQQSIFSADDVQSVSHKTEEKKIHFVFECDITRGQAEKLKAFTDSIGITLKRVKNGN